jgi:hypothetical protein
MKIESLHIGMKVRHPQYGVGVVKTISETMSDVEFDTAGPQRVSPELAGMEPADAQAEISGATLPLKQLIQQTVAAAISALGLEKPDSVVDDLGSRWQKGTLVLRPADPALQGKEVPVEVFFHKIVGLRNQLRVLEQKINAHPNLSDAEKVDMQQYISRCYGSMTTFNILFRNKEDQFSSKGE